MRLRDVLVMVPFDAAPPPVVDGMVVQAHRGGRKGQYLVVTTTAPKAGPVSGANRASEYRGGRAEQLQEKVEQIVMEKIAEAVQKKADEVIHVETCVDEKKKVL